MASPFKDEADTITVERERWNQLVRDHNDMIRACQTVFVRCACGRLRESGIICPTVQDGGDCEAGR